MTLLGLILTIALVGFLLWLLNTLVPMDAKVKQILNIVVIFLLVLWLLESVFGIFGALDRPIFRR